MLDALTVVSRTDRSITAIAHNVNLNNVAEIGRIERPADLTRCTLQVVGRSGPVTTCVVAIKGSLGIPEASFAFDMAIAQTGDGASNLSEYVGSAPWLVLAVTTAEGSAATGDVILYLHTNEV